MAIGDVTSGMSTSGGIYFTGIGSGTVHYEESLSATRESAEEMARLEAHRVQTEHDERVKRNRDEQKRKARRKPRKACGR